MSSNWAYCDKFGQESLLHINFTSTYEDIILCVTRLLRGLHLFSSPVPIIIEGNFFECGAYRFYIL